MKNIFRIIHLNDESIEELYVYQYGIKEEYKTDITNEIETYKELIGEKNYNSIRENSKKVKVYLINDTIYLDDTIDTIKRKIIQSFNKRVSFEELYLFGLKQDTFDNYSVFETLTQNRNTSITKNKLIQYILNFTTIDIKNLNLDKDTYSYDDIIKLNIDKKTKLYKHPYGHSFRIEKNYPITINPFDVVVYDKFIERNASSIVSTENKKLLMDEILPYENNIYVCFAEDVYEYMKKYDLSQEVACKLYYPFLYEKNIIDLKTLKENKTQLLETNKERLDDTFETKNEIIHLFHEIYKKRTINLDYITKGIKVIELSILPKYNIILPLELIFKLIQSNKEMPFMKYNPGKGREKVYRLYSDKIAKNGKKIPYLSRASIMKLRKNLAREKSVSLYFYRQEFEEKTENTQTNKTQIDEELIYQDKRENNVIVTFFENGIVDIKIDSNKPFTSEMVENMILTKINPILYKIKDFLEQHGYTYSLFDGFYTSNIRINRIQYESYLSIMKKLDLKKFNCLSYLFNIIQSNLNDDIILRYKRVSYFNQMDSIEAFITEMTNLGSSALDIIEAVKDNFNITNDKASMKYTEWLSNIRLEQQLYENKKLKVKSNPGFPITIKKEKFKNNIIITADYINNLHYIDYLNIFIDTMIRLTQDIESTDVNKKKINKLCKKEYEEKDVELKEKVNKVDNLLSNQKDYEISDEGFEDFEDLDDEYGLLGLLEEDEIDIENDTMIGGANNEEIDEDSDEDILEFEEELEDETQKNDKTTMNNINKSNEDIDEDIDGDLLLDLEEGSTISEEILEQEGKEQQEEKKKTPKQQKEPREKNDNGFLEEDITGMPLTNPNYFFQRMTNRDPRLFLKKKDGKFKAYSRICPYNVKRQPVILTEEEKEKIDREYPGSYEKAIHYGSTDEKKHWYICPRYWCLKTNTSMTEEDVKAGKCGGSSKIIPENAKKVPKDAFVFEFKNDSEHIDNKGNYITHYPGFVKEGSHPDGLCVPCCFKSWDVPSQIERRKKCLEGEKLTEKKEKEEPDEYIKGIDKFPLNQNRWGYLPISIQKILHTDNTKCYDNKTNNIKPFEYCLLRKGVEVNKTQSFIAVLADLYVEYQKNETKIVPSIREMRQIIQNAIDIDLFLSYNSGALVDIFYKEDETTNIDKYYSSEIYKKLNKKNKNERNLLHKICVSFENFNQFLQDDDVVIDHTFLWDIVSKPNKRLFPSGLNLAILEIAETDSTDNVELVCPTNNYSNEVFETKKPTLIIMKKNEFYEPIYLYRDEETRIYINKTFTAYNSHLMSNIKEMLEIIKLSYTKCGPLPSMPRVYTFKQNNNLIKTEKLLKKYKYEIETQIMNYNNKLIGLVIQTKDKNEKGYIPVEPSSMSKSYPYIYADDYEWNDLEHTINFLNQIYKKSKGEIPVKPFLKILEDGLIVGILTETNQFIPIEQPEENIKFQELEEIDGTNYFISDKITNTSNKIDKKREEMIKKIKLEGNFYNAFRNTSRILLNKYEMIQERKELEEIINDITLTYFEKLEKVKNILVKLLNDKVEFVSMNNETLMSLDSITTCLSEKCSEKQYCLTIDRTKETDTTNKNINESMNKKDDCKIIIPNKHLISEKPNERIYFERLSDELIRYGRIRNFMFKPKVYLSFDKVEYKLTNNEVILLDTILAEDYFDNLEEAYQNKYIIHTVPEFTQPQITQKYETKQELTKLMKPEKEKQCILKTSDIRGKWSKYFQEEYNEFIYKNTPNCTFELLLDIIVDYGLYETVESLKNILITKYRELIKKYGENKIVRRILKNQGKEKLVRQILEKRITIEQSIISENYYLTNMDYILLSQHLNIPLVIISGVSLQELKGWVLGLTPTRGVGKYKHTYMWIVNRNHKADYVYFIKQPAIKRNVIPEYSIIATQKNMKHKKIQMTKKLSSLMNVYKQRPTFEQFIENVKPIKQKEKIKLVIKSKKCKEDQILNPDTGRCINKSGETVNKLKIVSSSNNKTRKKTDRMTNKNKSLQKTKKCKEHQILNPYTGRCINKSGATAKKLKLVSK